MTEWRDVVGYEGIYQVSDDGRVRGLSRTILRANGIAMRVRGQVLNPISDRKGYLLVGLHNTGPSRLHRVHRLVLAAFIGPCPPGMVGCHNDGDPANNNIENLRWDTASSNNFDIVSHGNHRNSVKTHCPHGHPYTDANTIRFHGGWRRCRTCANEYRRRWRSATKRRVA